MVKIEAETCKILIKRVCFAVRMVVVSLFRVCFKNLWLRLLTVFYTQPNFASPGERGGLQKIGVRVRGVPPQKLISFDPFVNCIVVILVDFIDLVFFRKNFFFPLSFFFLSLFSFPPFFFSSPFPFFHYPSFSFPFFFTTPRFSRSVGSIFPLGSISGAL